MCLRHTCKHPTVNRTLAQDPDPISPKPRWIRRGKGKGILPECVGPQQPQHFNRDPDLRQRGITLRYSQETRMDNPPLLICGFP